MTCKIDDAVSIYQTLSKIPMLVRAEILNNGTSIISNWNERNLERNNSTKIMIMQSIDGELNVVSESLHGIDISDEMMSAVSPTEKFKAVLREIKNAKGCPVKYLEIWNKRQMMQSIELDALKLHGNIYRDSEFGSINWNNVENKIVYIAEKNNQKSESFLKKKVVKSTNTDDKTILPGNEFEYRADWGEQLVGKYNSSIIVYDIDTEIFTVVDAIPDNYCPGQVVWSPDNSSLVGVIWDTKPRKLGLMYCTNRASYIFSSTLTGEFKIISKAGKAVRSPRFSNDGKYLVWLQRDIPSSHHGCLQLVKTAWPLCDDMTVETVIDIIYDEINIEGNYKFTGIYSKDLIKRPFAIDGKRIVFTTPQETEARTYVVDTETKKITDISDKSFPSSTIILDVHHDLILASRSSFKQPAQLIMAKLPAAGLEQDIKWVLIDPHPIQINEEIASAKLEYMNLEHEGVTDTTKKFSAIFFGDSSRGLIVWPHGGPHSNFINSYSLEAAFFYLLGFSIIQVNYRGSTGAGEKSWMYLPGRVGDADVKDCVLATDEAIRRYSLDENNCALLGRSHGGYIVAHLSGQYPNKYKAAVLGNPVIDIVSKLNSTDTPDGTMFNIGVNFNEVGPISNDILLKLRNASPLVYAHNVKAPTLLCLGSKDRRVSYHQGVEYFHKLKANGCETKMLLYEDNHILHKTHVEADRIINSAIWLLKYIK